MQHSGERCCRQTNISINLQNEKKQTMKNTQKECQAKRVKQCSAGGGRARKQAKRSKTDTRPMPDRQADRGTDRETDRGTDRQRYKQIEGQTEREREVEAPTAAAPVQATLLCLWVGGLRQKVPKLVAEAALSQAKRYSA